MIQMRIGLDRTRISELSIELDHLWNAFIVVLESRIKGTSYSSLERTRSESREGGTLPLLPTVPCPCAMPRPMRPLNDSPLSVREWHRADLPLSTSSVLISMLRGWTPARPIRKAHK